MRRSISAALGVFFSLSAASADSVVAPDGTDAYFVLGWSGAADEICTLQTQRYVLFMARSKGLSDTEVANNLPKIMKAVGEAYASVGKIGKDQWCANYQRGFLTGK